MKYAISFNEATFDAFEAITKMHGSAAPGYPLGYRDLDHFFRVQAGTITAIGGRAGMGKTTLVMNLVANLAFKGTPCLVINRKMTPVEFTLRMASREARISKYRITMGYLVEQDFIRLANAAARLSELPIYLDHTPRLTLLDVLERIEEFGTEYPGGVVFLDDLQSLKITEATNSMERLHGISEAIKELREVAREHQVPLFIVSEALKSIDLRLDKRPGIGDLRGAGNLDDAADIVLMLYQDDFYHPDSYLKDHLDVRIVKNVYGPIGTVRLKIHKDHLRLEDLDLPEPATPSEPTAVQNTAEPTLKDPLLKENES